MDALSIVITVLFSLLTLTQTFFLARYNRERAWRVCTEIQELIQALRVARFKLKMEGLEEKNVDYSSEIKIIQKFFDSPSETILSNYSGKMYKKDWIKCESECKSESEFKSKFKSDYLSAEAFPTLMFYACRGDDYFIAELHEFLKKLDKDDYKGIVRMAKKSQLYFPTRPVVESGIDKYLISAETIKQMSEVK